MVVVSYSVSVSTLLIFIVFIAIVLFPKNFFTMLYDYTIFTELQVHLIPIAFFFKILCTRFNTVKLLKDKKSP